MNEEERFWRKVHKTEDCWEWTGGKKAAGYGHFSVKRDGSWGKMIAHRYSYESVVGPIPDKFEIDHLCRNRSCVRPDHLEAVPLAENRLRRDAARTHCTHGHCLADVGRYKDGKCAECVRIRARAARDRKLGRASGLPHGERTECPQGHPYSGDNLVLVPRPDGGVGRRCRTCARDAHRRAYRKRRAAQAPS